RCTAPAATSTTQSPIACAPRTSLIVLVRHTPDAAGDRAKRALQRRAVRSVVEERGAARVCRVVAVGYFYTCGVEVLRGTASARHLVQEHRVDAIASLRAEADHVREDFRSREFFHDWNRRRSRFGRAGVAAVGDEHHVLLSIRDGDLCEL